MKSIIDINFEKESFKKNIKQKELKNWLKKILKELKLENKSCSLFFTNCDTIKKLNKQYRNKDYVTDVLSFSQIEGESVANSNFIGDIVICIVKAEEQSKELGHSFESEIKFLILHSVLHLIGFDHETDNGEMVKLENEIFKKLTGEIIE